MQKSGRIPCSFPREAAPFCTRQNLPLCIKKSFNSCQKSLQRIKSDSPKAAPVPRRFRGNAASNSSDSSTGSFRQFPAWKSQVAATSPRTSGCCRRIWEFSPPSCGSPGLEAPGWVLKLCPTDIPVILTQGVSVGIRGSGTGWKQRQVSATCGAAKLTGSREFSFGSLTVTAVVWED